MLTADVRDRREVISKEDVENQRLLRGWELKTKQSQAKEKPQLILPEHPFTYDVYFCFKKNNHHLSPFIKENHGINFENKEQRWERGEGKEGKERTGRVAWAGAG